MSDFGNKLHNYANGWYESPCFHPLNKIVEIGYKNICTLCGKVIFVEFDPSTMTRATPTDIFRIWREIYGKDVTPK